MLKKIVINNVGVLKAFSTPGSPRLERLTTIHARNGRGKSTLTAILRAAGDGTAEPVVGRHSFGSDRPPEIILARDSGTVRFAGDRWSSRLPVEVFDTHFISENVHAGEMPDLEHDRGLFSVIVGRDGVRLGRRLEFFSGAAKRTAARLKAAEQALALDRPSDMPLADFVAYAADGELDERIAAAERSLRSARQAERVSKLAELAPLPLPTVPAAVASVLGATVAEVDTSARERLAEHFRRFGLGKAGGEWVRFGLEHVHGDACPMCGRDGVDEQGLVTLYAAVFSESYRNHLGSVAAAADAVRDALGPPARDRAERILAGNGTLVRDWAEFHDTSGFALPDVSAALVDLARAHEALSSLMETKRASPLEPVDAQDVVGACLEAVGRAAARVREYNEAVDVANASLRGRRSVEAIPEARAVALLRDLTKLRDRLDPGVASRIATYERVRRRDECARRMRKVAQDRLKAANLDASEHYHRRVNHYLDRFGAKFAISEITNSMAGNAGASDYGLLVRGTPVTRGRGRDRQSEGTPNFRNALSTADKTTLALAFFLAKLDRDPDLAGRIVVFDDPLSSHDSHRRTRTVEALRELGTRCRQILVLSHDERFVRELCRACHAMSPVTYQIEFEGPEQWSVARSVDADDLCRGDHAISVDALKAFHERRGGDPATAVMHVRRVLETHFRRAYSGWFGPVDDLGAIVDSIRREGPTHPCSPLLTRLDACNAATRERHHGEDARLGSRTAVDPDELGGIVGDALVLIGAVRS
ncbi:AAA family ATPase [Aureimonas sp. AU22]|uniref:AAA family ATPase n=1 Tax=Aureimonas sp. AU22 TaxID=1638162 RepID=UPI000AAF163E|nr:AAA family ATPase [Aureimonas sp. AU22]